ncbi:MAG: Xaa-Pro peptidase family protein [Fimbriimonadaceae bacterium]
MLDLFRARIEMLAAELRNEAYVAYFAWSPETMGYLHGLFEGAHERFLLLAVRANGEVRLICPSLTVSQAARCGIPDIRPWRDGEDPLALYAELADDWDLKAGFVAVDDEMPAHMLLAMQVATPATAFVRGHPVVSRLQRVKSEFELEKMRAASRVAEAALAAGLAAIRPGASEREVADALEGALRAGGGRPTFCIVAAGAHGAEPHHGVSDDVIREGDVVILDFGCDLDHYQSDMTRTVACRRAEDEAYRVYELVYRAHMAAREVVAPGVEAQTVDRAARKVIEQGGYGPYFIHRTGHGIGMRVHEEPNIVEGNAHRLEPGNCFSIEPGIYLPGRFGVRIENLVGVTAAGHESFNNDPSPRLVEV